MFSGQGGASNESALEGGDTGNPPPDDDDHTNHGMQRAEQAKEDRHRNFGDANRVIRESRVFRDTERQERGNRLSVVAIAESQPRQLRRRVTNHEPECPFHKSADCYVMV
jgi:hypothetical protein